jgi:hypothetical protein
VRRLATLPSLIYVAALGVAIGTQFYAVLVLAAHVAILLAKDRFDVGWRRRTEAVLVIGILPYAGMARQLIFSTRTRSGSFQPRFPLLATRELLGHQYLAVAILGALTVSALATVAVRRRLGPATAAIAVELGIIWVVLHPRDLYPRFLVWLVPAVALAAAWCVSRRPRLAFVVAVAVGAMVLSQAGTWMSDPIASRQIARIVDDARATGAHPCAAGYSAELLLGYTQAVRSVRSVQTVDQLAGCDFVFAVVDNSAPELRRFGCRFARLEVLPGVSRVVVLSSPRRLDDPTPCATR